MADAGRGGGNGWKQVSLILAGMAALAGIHAGVVVPAILHEAAQETTTMIEAHGRREDARYAAHIENPHPGAVSRKEFEMIMANQRDMRTEMREIRKLLTSRR